MKDLEKLLMGKKDSSKMSDNAAQAKMDVLQELMDMCREQMGNKVKDGMHEMQKVTVAAPDKEALALGLDKAKQLTQHMPEEMEEDPAEEAKETPEEEAKEPMDIDDLMSDEADEDSMFAKKKK
jgi:hypothetical protein